MNAYLKYSTACLASGCMLILTISCGSSHSSGPANSAEQITALEADLRADLDNLSTDTDFTLAIKAENGRSFIHSTGSSSDTTSYESASTSKLVSAAVILSVVEQGLLSLDAHPQDYIAGWPVTGHQSDITLQHLLNFTSGLSNEALCIHLPNADFEQCVLTLSSSNASSPAPGSQYYYSSSHLQVAGLMAVNAAGLNDWQQLFEQFKNSTQLFNHALYDLPSIDNPRLAGGMHWNALEYLDFLQAIVDQTILTPALLTKLSNDQLGSATIGYSPAIDAINEDWHYGYGVWIECHSLLFNCNQVSQISSPGAYGAYPFINYQHVFYGILARQGSLGTFANGYAAFQQVSVKLTQWADMNRL